MEIGSSQSFVIAQGFRQIGEHWGLIGHDGSLRLFAQLTADPDRPAVRPVEAYQTMLSSMQPGWTMRWLQIFWPDPTPRKHFFEHAENWCEPGEEGKGKNSCVRAYYCSFRKLLCLSCSGPLLSFFHLVMKVLHGGTDCQSCWGLMVCWLSHYLWMKSRNWPAVSSTQSWNDTRNTISVAT